MTYTAEQIFIRAEDVEFARNHGMSLTGQCADDVIGMLRQAAALLREQAKCAQGGARAFIADGPKGHVIAEDLKWGNQFLTDGAKANGWKLTWLYTAPRAAVPDVALRMIENAAASYKVPCHLTPSKAEYVKAAARSFIAHLNAQLSAAPSDGGEQGGDHE